MSRKLIVHADDLGLSRSFNRGIRETFVRGQLTSTSIRVNGPAFEEAVTEVVPECRGLGVGLHLNVVEGRSTRRIIPRSSLLCDPDGTYRLNFTSLLARQRDSALLREVDADWRDQFERAANRLPGLDHVNSHQHSHAVPALFNQACKLAVEYGIRFVRLCREPYHMPRSAGGLLRPWLATNVAKVIVLNCLAHWNIRAAGKHDVATNSWLVGIVATGHMTLGSVLRGLDAVSKRLGEPDADVVELLLHPVLRVAQDQEKFITPGVRRYIMDPARVTEVETLLSPELGPALDSRGWRSVRYRDLTSLDGRLPPPASATSGRHRMTGDVG